MCFGQLDQRCRQRCLVTASVMQLHFDGEPVSKNFPPLTERPLSRLESTVTETGCDRPRGGTGQHLNSFTPLRYLLPGDARASPRFFPISFLPRRELADPRSGDERSDVVESPFAARQNGDRTAIDIELGADDRSDVLPSCFQSEADYAAQIRGVGDADGFVAECSCAGD